MPTSGTSLVADPTGSAIGPPRPAAGFSLLEIVVVLAIMGLLAAIAIPATVRGIDSWRRQAQMDALQDQVRALPGLARGSGREIVVSDEALAGPSPPLRVEEGWRLSTPEPWRVQANGVCQGGTLLLQGPGPERSLQVAAPFCDPVAGG